MPRKNDITADIGTAPVDRGRRDLTTGSVPKKLIAFTLPIIGSNLLTAVYNIVDMVIVGQFAGAVGMSAVSIGGQVTFMTLMLCTGLSNGCSVLVGNLFGLHEEGEIKRYVGSMLSFLILLASVLTACSVLLIDPFLTLLNTPEDCYAEARSYLVICMLGTVFVYIYGLFSGALRGIGESMRPLIFVAVTTVENVVLDLLFVAVFNWGAAGAAAATVISQACCALLVCVYTKRKTNLFDFNPDSFRIHGDKLKNMLKVGLPQAIQFTCTNISFLFIGALVNGYGVSAVAAAGAATKLGSLGMLPGNSCMAAIMTLTSQNHPLKNHRRIISGLIWGIGLSLCVTLIFFSLCQLMPETMYGLFVDSPEVIEVGRSYLRIYSLSFLDETVMFCLFGVIAGSGYTIVSMVTMIVCAFGVRCVLAYVLSGYTAMGFDGIAMAYTAAPLLGIAVELVFICSGRWKIDRLSSKRL